MIDQMFGDKSEIILVNFLITLSMLIDMPDIKIAEVRRARRRMYGREKSNK